MPMHFVGMVHTKKKPLLDKPLLSVPNNHSSDSQLTLKYIILLIHYKFCLIDH